jgi:hypothetical protein
MINISNFHDISRLQQIFVPCSELNSNIAKIGHKLYSEEGQHCLKHVIGQYWHETIHKSYFFRCCVYTENSIEA